MKKIRFEKGDMISWKDNLDGSLRAVGPDKYGQGPFKVEKTEDVPRDRTCNGQLLFDVVGHPQWVIIIINNEEKKFSGFYFKKEK